MTDLPFLDANVILRFVTQDEPNHSARATLWFGQVGRGEVRVRTADTVVFETVFTLQSTYRWDRQRISDALLPILRLDAIELANKSLLVDAFALYVTRRGLSWADCYHAVLARQLGSTEIVSFDRGFDRVPGITRIEPPPLGET